MSKIIIVIPILILITTLRTATGTLIPNLEMFGGNFSNAWTAPFFADVALGVMAPFVAYLTWKKVGKRLWGFLVVYNTVGGVRLLARTCDKHTHTQSNKPKHDFSFSFVYDSSDNNFIPSF